MISIILSSLFFFIFFYLILLLLLLLLLGRLAALNRFIARLGEPTLSFFKTLRNIANFEWTEGCQRAFEELKIYLSFPKILSQPQENEDLFL
jgi:hypothetical protein